MHVLAIVKRDDADGNASAFLSHAAASNSLDVSGWEAATCRRRLGAPMFSPTQPRQSKVSVSADSSNYHIIWIDLKPLGQINTRQRRHVTLQRKTQRSTDACACRDRQKCTREDEFMYGCAVGRVVFLDGCGNGFIRFSARKSVLPKTAIDGFYAWRAVLRALIGSLINHVRGWRCAELERAMFQVTQSPKHRQMRRDYDAVSETQRRFQRSNVQRL